MTALDFDRFDVLTFDCYGTLIDWERGLLDALRGPMASHGIADSDDVLLESFARHEAAAEAGPYRTYREILGEVLEAMLAERGAAAEADERQAFGGSVAGWPPFPDSTAALARLHDRFKLGVITNCDDDLFGATTRRLRVTFDPVVTAEQAQRYKPSHRNFEMAFERLNLPRGQILHVAQSLFHDHVPARELGLSSVWVDRRQDRPGSGATRPASATPDLVVPDLATLADIATA
jgi:2-haloacid dehalogenase